MGYPSDIEVVLRGSIAEALDSFDAVWQAKLDQYVGWISSDVLVKARADRYAIDAPEVFALLLVTGISGEPKAPKGVVKYANYLRRFRDQVDLAAQATVAIEA